MNVIQFLIDHARESAKSLRESHTPETSSLDFEAVAEAKQIDMAANLAEHALVSLGLVKRREQPDDGA